MLQTIDEKLPARWQEKWRVMDLERTARKEKWQTVHGTLPDEDIACQLQEWFEQVYLEGNNEEDLKKADIDRIGALIGSMLRLEPSARASARDVLQDSWLEKQ